MKHLVNHYTKGNKIYPGDPNIREEVDKYLYYDEEEVFPAISNWIVSDRLKNTINEPNIF